MKLQDPVTITPRLLPGIKVGGTYISIEYDRLPGAEGRARYRWYADLPSGKSFSGNDLQSGCGGGSLQFGLESLLDFLIACGESWNYNRENGENSNLFPREVVEWTAENVDELTMAECELTENPEAIVE